MKDLKDYIKNNREIFDDQEPGEGHFERFEALLNKKDQVKPSIEVKKNLKRHNLLKYISVAASIAILAVIGFHFYEPNKIIPTKSDTENIQSISDEFRATNNYYQRQMESQIADIMCKLSDTDTENQSQLSDDLKQIMDNNKTFVDEMASNDNKELAIHYLIKHYKKNIQILKNINEKLGKYTKC